MKRNFVILATTLILTGLLGVASMTHAQRVPKGGKWDQKKDLPTPRADTNAVVVNNLIYVMGGRDGKLEERFATVEVYNPSNDTWKKGTDMPAASEQGSAAAVGGKIYVFGGYTSVKRRGKVILKSLATTDAYDPAADAWEKKADMLIARAHTTASAVDGKIYVIGGQDNVAGGEQRVDIYDTATDTWAKGPDLIEKRWVGPSSSAVNGKIYAVGGHRKEDHVVDFVAEYDPATNKWSKKALLITPRYHSAVHAPVAGGKIYLIGGWGGGGDNITNLNEEYDPAKDLWAAVTKMPTKRMAFDAAVVRGKIYVFGGVLESGKRNGNKMERGLFAAEVVTAIVEEYTPPGWPFAVEPQGKLATTWATIKATD